MKTSLPGILIHSTTKPWSIYTYASHGCIRVFPQRMEELFKLVTTNTPGEIIYKPVKLAVTDDGKILLEAHGDIYNKTRGLESEAQALIRAHKLDGKVDWEKVKRVISRKAGVAEEITRISPEEKTVNTASVQSPS
jgi:L,D-transpeptidase ErfK/SrfK